MHSTSKYTLALASRDLPGIGSRSSAIPSVRLADLGRASGLGPEEPREHRRELHLAVLKRSLKVDENDTATIFDHEYCCYFTEGDSLR